MKFRDVVITILVMLFLGLAVEHYRLKKDYEEFKDVTNALNELEAIYDGV